MTESLLLLVSLNVSGLAVLLDKTTGQCISYAQILNNKGAVVGTTNIHFPFTYSISKLLHDYYNYKIWKRMSENIYKKSSNKQRIGFLLLSVLVVLCAALMNLLYRPYIYENNIFDYHIADSNSICFAVPAAIYFWLSIEKSTVSAEV